MIYLFLLASGNRFLLSEEPPVTLLLLTLVFKHRRMKYQFLMNSSRAFCYWCEQVECLDNAGYCVGCGKHADTMPSNKERIEREKVKQLGEPIPDFPKSNFGPY
jgi:hypothetical protein